MRDDDEQLQKEKGEMVNRDTKLQRYSSKLCLTFHGVRDGGDYSPHKIVEIFRSVQNTIEPYVIADCYYLPSNGKTKLNIVKFFYNHQREEIWLKCILFFDPQNEKKNHIIERLTETNRNFYIYCGAKKPGNSYPQKSSTCKNI